METESVVSRMETSINTGGGQAQLTWRCSSRWFVSAIPWYHGSPMLAISERAQPRRTFSQGDDGSRYKRDVQSTSRRPAKGPKATTPSRGPARPLAPRLSRREVRFQECQTWDGIFDKLATCQRQAGAEYNRSAHQRQKSKRCCLV